MAAGAHQLVLEEPILLDDALAQSVNMKRLKDFVRGNTDSQKRNEPTLLVSSGTLLGDEEFSLYLENRAIHALTYDLFASGDIASLLVRIALAGEAGIDAYLRMGWPARPVSPRWLEMAIDIATAARPSGLILSYDNGDEGPYSIARRHLAERAAIASI
jgi:hypothetical protein